MRNPTCEDRGFEQLDELVNLDEHVDGHFEVGAVCVSVSLGGDARSSQYLKEVISLLVCLG